MPSKGICRIWRMSPPLLKLCLMKIMKVPGVKTSLLRSVWRWFPPRSWTTQPTLPHKISILVIALYETTILVTLLVLVNHRAKWLCIFIIDIWIYINSWTNLIWKLLVMESPKYIQYSLTGIFFWGQIYCFCMACCYLYGQYIHLRLSCWLEHSD